MTVALPRIDPISQFNDPTTTQDGLNCTSTSLVMLGELATGKRMFPGEFRKLQSDQEGGISIPDGARAWQKAYPDAELVWAAADDGPRPPGRVGSTITAQGAWELLSDGYGMVVQGVYLVIEAAGFSLQHGFREGHAMYLDGVRVFTISRRKQAYVIDPLGRGDYRGQWMDWQVLTDYALALGRGGFYAAWASPKLPDSGTGDAMTTITVLPFGGVFTIEAGKSVTGYAARPDGSIDTTKPKVWPARPSPSRASYDATMVTDATTGNPFLRAVDGFFAGHYISSAQVVEVPNEFVDNFNQGVEAAAQKALTAKR